MAAATKADENVVVLIDGTKVSVRPLKISLLRPFMKKFEGIAAVAEDNEKSMNILMPNLISPHALVDASTTLGEANIICARAFVGPQADLMLFWGFFRLFMPKLPND